MSAAPIAVETAGSQRRRSPLQAILWGGIASGILDLTAACVIWGLRAGVKPGRILQSVASGVLGPAAYRGGLRTAALGLALHFLIALTASAVYYAASSKFIFLIRHGFRWGLLYGIAVYIVMNWIVVPLSAAPHNKGAHTLPAIAIAVITHMFCVGLPISLAVRRFSR